MKIITLVRSYLFDEKTVGYIPEVDLHTLEDPWRNNEPFNSCIPEGVYKVKRDRVGRYRWFAVEGVEERTAIEFHEGNYEADTAGCILVGMGRDSKWNLTNSIKGLNVLSDFIGSDEEFILNIRQYNPLTDGSLF